MYIASMPRIIKPVEENALNDFRLVFIGANPRHTRFMLYDKYNANCGNICMLTEDAWYFVQIIWNGKIDWRDRWPEFLEFFIDKATEDGNAQAR